jgi:hypothetical protein
MIKGSDNAMCGLHHAQGDKEHGFLGSASKPRLEFESQRSRGDEVEYGRVDAMGCIGLFYPNFAIFAVLGHKGSLVTSFHINRTPRASVEVSIQPSLSHSLAIVVF